MFCWHRSESVSAESGPAAGVGSASVTVNVAPFAAAWPSGKVSAAPPAPCAAVPQS